MVEDNLQEPKEPNNTQNVPDGNGAGSAGKKKDHIFSEDFKNYIRGVIDLRHGVEVEKTIADICKNISMEGANAWMLMCSIVIASIGLSQNSQAVIIGGMLISPLMSPILGVGLSVGINDKETLRSSIVHFSIAMLIALVTSWVYFEVTPFNGLTPEIEARTKPTFLDIFIAIFGGIAGIISNARKDVPTAIPGVAIATALMPPLCVTGYGLATSNWEIATNSFYLFFLNSFFVALATYVIVRLLDFPQKDYRDAKMERRGQVVAALFSLAIMIPSFFIFRGVIRDLQRELSLEKFADTCLGDKKHFLDSYTYDNHIKDDIVLYLKVYGDVINNENISQYEPCLRSLNLDHKRVVVINTSEVAVDDVALLEKDIEEVEKMIAASQEAQRNSQRMIDFYKQTAIDTSTFQSIKSELQSFYPDLKELTVSRGHTTDFATSNMNMPVLIVEWPDLSESERVVRTEKISGYITARLQVDTVRIISL